jgi:hypothetical protein
MRFLYAASAGFMAAVLLPAPAAAQTVSEVVPSLLTRSTVINAQGNLPGIGHTAHFYPDFDQLITPTIINQSIIGQLPTFPIGSSSGSLTYSFDAALGAFTRSSESFGPSFAERPLTIGRRKFSFGFNFQHSRYDSFEGKDLEGAEMRFYVRHNDCCPGQDPVTGAPGPNAPPLGTPAFEGDLVETALALDLKADLFSVFANYGVTDRLDVGFAIPIVRVDLSAGVTSTLLRLSTEADRNIHLFPGGNPDALRMTGSANASGIGDVLVRTKLNVGQSDRGAGAVALDLRLPTGDEENLLGTGETQAKFYGIASANLGRLSPHVNAGYTFSSGDLADEFNYTVGFDASIVPRLSVAADVIGRVLRDAGRFDDVARTFNYVTLADTSTVRTANFQQLQFREGNLHLTLGAVGVKANVGGTLLVTASVLFPLSDNGLKPGVTPVIGFDYAF